MGKRLMTTKEKIKVGNQTYTLIRKVIDSDLGCTFYYTEEYDEPFCDLDNEIEVIRCQDKD